MPIYEYYCKDCGKKFDALQKITAPPLTKCKFCSGNVEKLVSNSSFKLKGGGWYVTDYKNKSKNTTKKTISKNNKVQKPTIKTENKTDKKPINEQKKVS